MSSFKRIFSIRTPAVKYENFSNQCSIFQTAGKPDEISIQGKIIKPNTLQFSSDPIEKRHSLTPQKLVLKPKRVRPKEANSLRFKTESSDYSTQINLRYKCSGMSTKVKIQRRKMKSNDALIIERIPTPSNLYLKEIQAFSVSRNRLSRKKQISINLFN